MERGLVAAMALAYRNPRGAMARQVAAGLSEPRALRHLSLACGIAFVASLPGAAREAAALRDVPDPVTGVIAAHLFGYFFLAPLLLYGLAAILHLIARACGGQGGFLGARAAVFWSALLGAPLALALALAGVSAAVAGAPGLLPPLNYLGYVGLGLWLWLLAASLAEVEEFAATRRVAAALALGFAGVALGLAGAAPRVG